MKIKSSSCCICQKSCKFVKYYKSWNMDVCAECNKEMEDIWNELYDKDGELRPNKKPEYCTCENQYLYSGSDGSICANCNHDIEPQEGK